jgi:hypothetical protein
LGHTLYISENVLLGRKHSNESEAFVNVNRLRITSSGMFCVTEVFNQCYNVIFSPVFHGTKKKSCNFVSRCILLYSTWWIIFQKTAETQKCQENKYKFLCPVPTLPPNKWALIHLWQSPSLQLVKQCTAYLTIILHYLNITFQKTLILYSDKYIRAANSM